MELFTHVACEKEALSICILKSLQPVTF